MRAKNREEWNLLCYILHSIPWLQPYQTETFSLVSCDSLSGSLGPLQSNHLGKIPEKEDIHHTVLWHSFLCVQITFWTLIFTFLEHYLLFKGQWWRLGCDIPMVRLFATKKLRNPIERKQTYRHLDTSPFRHIAIWTYQHLDTPYFGHMAWNTNGCAQAPAARLTGPSALQGLLLLYPASALIVRPYADSSELSQDN